MTDPATDRPDRNDAPLGVVLRTTPLRESDLLVVLYTDVHGRVTAVARGARKSKRRFAGALSLLVLGRYQLGRRPRGELWGLESADVVREWTRLSSDVVAVAHASYVAELVASLLPPEAPDPHALDIIVALWDALAAGGPSPGALRAVEIALLDLAGHRPAIDHCAACSRTDLVEGTVFDPKRGGAICRPCAARSRDTGVRPFAPSARAYLHAIAELDTPLAARAIDQDPQFAAADRIAARDALVAMVTDLVGRPLRSLEYLAKLGAAGRGAKE
ncbi:MAG TPA: DNA repair protein RecO [Kofleriaceae bacterium]|nr:DNA repair protein RecO [Kofleriaceae bacterium]